jgi:hypothetical protein
MENHMSTTPRSFITEGTTVRIDHPTYLGTLWTVERIKQTKAIIRGADEATRNRFPRGLDAPRNLLVPADGEAPKPEPRDVQAEAAKRLAELEFQMQFETGVLVRIKKAYGSYTTSDLFVVTANNDKTASVVKVGGDGGRYLRVPHAGLTIVDAADVLK